MRTSSYPFSALLLVLLLGAVSGAAQQTTSAAVDHAAPSDVSSHESAPPTAIAEQKPLDAPMAKDPAPDKSSLIADQPVMLHCPGELFCARTAADNASFAAKHTIDPMTFLLAGAMAGISQADNGEKGYGQGARGYGKRFGARMADAAVYESTGHFLLPTLFRQDPRYRRVGGSNLMRRLGHAMSSSFVAQNRSCQPTFNISEIGGAAIMSGASLGYYPRDERTYGDYFKRFGMKIAGGMGRNLWKEFGPDWMGKLFHRR